MRTSRSFIAILCGLLLLPLIQSQAQSVRDLQTTIKEKDAQIEKLREEKQTLETKLRKCQKKNSEDNCEELRSQNLQLSRENQQLRDANSVLLKASMDEDKTPIEIKDPIFKAYLLRYCDMDDDGVITTWDAEHTYVIDCSKANKSGWGSILQRESQSISTLEGIEAYKNLKKLVCSGNTIPMLDLSNNTSLVTIEADGCGLRVLNISGNKDLKRLSCNNNALRDLDLSDKDNLVYLDVNHNQLNILSLNHSPKLSRLNCSDNGMVSLMAPDNAELLYVDCSNNVLTTLDLSKTAADSIMCQNNGLTFVDLRNDKDISYLDCSKNKNLKEVLISNGHYVVSDVNKKIRYR